MFTTAHHWSPSWTRWAQFTPCYHISLRFILILSFHLSLDFPREILLQIFWEHFFKRLQFFSCILYFQPLNFLRGFISLMFCYDYDASHYALLSNSVQIFSSAPGSQTALISALLLERGTDAFIVLNVQIFIFLWWQEDKMFCTMSSTSIYYTFLHRSFNFTTFSKDLLSEDYCLLVQDYTTSQLKRH
jgi:hypothetical protein